MSLITRPLHATDRLTCQRAAMKQHSRARMRSRVADAGKLQMKQCGGQTYGES